MGTAIRHIFLLVFILFLPGASVQALHHPAKIKGGTALFSHTQLKKGFGFQETGPLYCKRKFKAKGTEVYSAQVPPHFIFHRSYSVYRHAGHCGTVFLVSGYIYHKRGPPHHA